VTFEGDATLVNRSPYLRRGVVLAAGLLLSAPGCSPSPPAVVEVEGVVLLDGKPLPNAEVVFFPELKSFGAEYNASAITDKDGKFQLVREQTKKPGGAVGLNRVVVRDPPMPAELRGMDRRSQEAQAKYLQGLVNRPIPAAYAAMGSTTVKIEVKADQKTYEIKLTR
jgi:hypothetical protein